jgi:folate-binding protein YgfZ
MDGDEGKSFLQGFVTADMERGNDESFYSMMLNAQGRVLFDLLLYPLLNNSYYLECDSRIRNNLITHLRKYALRAKVKFAPVDDHRVWALFPGQPSTPPVETTERKFILSPDPRSRSFGTRVILPSQMSPSHLWPNTEIVDIGIYHRHRMVSGIPEGSDDIISGRSLPLECNLDYMNGVSFGKGCYLGQELTARTHHTGVVRKRIVPVTLSPGTPVQSGADVTSGSGGDGKRTGRILSSHGRHGLALLKLSAASKGELCARDEDGKEVTVTAHIPEYWPSQTHSSSSTSNQQS